MESKLGWDRVLKNKQVLTSKVPSAVIVFIKVKDSPSRTHCQASPMLRGQGGHLGSSFPKTINSEHTTKIDLSTSSALTKPEAELKDIIHKM